MAGHGAGVRPMVPADTKEAAHLHAVHLPHGLFPQLGRRFLRRYYQTFLASPHAIALATGPPGAPTGVLVGIAAPRAHLDWVVRHLGVRLAFAGTGAILARPWLLGGFVRRRLPRYLRALRSVLKTRGGGAGTAGAGGDRSPDHPAGVLSHIVVSPAARRGRAGAHLVDAFLAELARGGIENVRATTLEGPDGAVPFYERTGWQRRSDSKNWDGETIVLFERPTGADVQAD